MTHLADLVSKQLLFDDEVREIVRLAGLLHDVGHGPFSHLFENVMENVNGEKIEHDRISMMLIKEDPDISSILGDKGEKVIQLLDHKPMSGLDRKISSLAADVISGPLDVDKMDYLRRDSYNIGVAYGQFDLPRIIHTLTRTGDSIEQHICAGYKGKDAIENYRLGRYLMHAQVYQHHARLAGDQMFLQALDLAVGEENIIQSDVLCTNTDLNKSHKEFLDFYTCLDVYSPESRSPPQSGGQGHRNPCPQPYCHGKQRCVGMEQKDGQIQGSCTPQCYEIEYQPGTMDNTGKDERREDQLRNSRDYEGINTLGQEAMGQIQAYSSQADKPSVANGQAGILDDRAPRALGRSVC